MERETKDRGRRDGPGGLALVKHLVAAGVGSRRASAKLIIGGRVQVNGQLVASLTHVVKAGDHVTVDGRQTDASRSKPTYLMLHKPAGYLTTVRDDRGRRTVLALVPQESYAPGLVPVGRLDMDTTGLLLLTNDGDLAYRLTHPRYQVEKEYQVEVDGPLTRQQVQRLLSGVELPEGPARVVSVKPFTGAGEPGKGQMRAPAGLPRSRPAAPATARYTVTLVEGQKREVRLLLQAMGRQVLELRRVRMGTVNLGGLEQGRVRHLTQTEVQRLKGIVASPRRSGMAEGRPVQRARPSAPIASGLAAKVATRGTAHGGLQQAQVRESDVSDRSRESFSGPRRR